MKDYKKNRRKKVRNIVYYGASQYWSFLLDVDIFVLVRNSARDSKKGDKLAKRWLGPYQIHEYNNLSERVFINCQIHLGVF